MAPLATVGIISIGEMGLGIARILVAHNYRVLSNVSDRSPATRKRAENVSIITVSSDNDLVSEPDYILSIVPPKHARNTARRVLQALQSRETAQPLYFLELNAIAPSTSRSIAAEFEPLKDKVRYIDGGIIGSPPKPNEAQADNSLSKDPDPTAWTRPSIVLSGPAPLSSAPRAGADLAHVLNASHVSDAIGVASGLKCCFASLTKGYTALALQSFSTARALGVLPELQASMAAHNPAGLERARRGLPGMVTKAGRWVDEMREIGKAFSEEAGWAGAAAAAAAQGVPGVFDGVADVYAVVAEDPLLAKETLENRKRGTTAEDVVDTLLEGTLAKRRRKG